MNVSATDTVGYGTRRMSLRKRVQGNMQPGTTVAEALGQSTLCSSQVSRQGPDKTACIPCIIRHCTHATHRASWKSVDRGSAQISSKVPTQPYRG
jgi:hypothetical protein